MTTKTKIAAFVAATLLVAPVAALAQETSVSGSIQSSAGVHGDGVRANAGANAKTNVSENKDARLSEKLATAKDRASKEIERRIENLDKLKTRIASMKRVSAEGQAALQTSVGAQISEMNTLSAQIAADDATSSLRTDIQSITKSYRIYALVIPQAAVVAAADRVLGVVASMESLSTKLHARADSTSATVLADFDAKVADAKVQANGAISAVASLKPDNGDDSLRTANAAALKDARAKVQAAQQDLKAARQDAAAFVKGLEESKASARATTTVEAR